MTIKKSIPFPNFSYKMAVILFRNIIKINMQLNKKLYHNLSNKLPFFNFREVKESFIVTLIHPILSLKTIE